jgi:hypothetical protein
MRGGCCLFFSVDPRRRGGLRSARLRWAVFSASLGGIESDFSRSWGVLVVVDLVREFLDGLLDVLVLSGLAELVENELLV